MKHATAPSVSMMSGLRGLGPLIAMLVLVAAVPMRSRLGASAMAGWRSAMRGGDGWRIARAILQPKEFGGSARGESGSGAVAALDGNTLAPPADGMGPHEAALMRAAQQGWVACGDAKDGFAKCQEEWRAMRGRLPEALALEAIMLRDEDGSRVVAAMEAARSAGLEGVEEPSVHAAFLRDPDRKRIDDVERALALATLWGLQWPVAAGTRISSPFGERVHPVLGTRKMHDGVDLATPTGTELHAASTAKVVHVGRDSVSGLYVVLDHGHQVQSVSCHLSEALAKTGGRIVVDGVYAKTGATGRVTGPHLHYGVRVGGRFVDPVGALRRH